MHIVLIHNKTWNDREFNRFSVSDMRREGHGVICLQLRANRWNDLVADYLAILTKVLSWRDSAVVPLFRLSAKTSLFFFLMWLVRLKIVFLIDLQANSGQMVPANHSFLRIIRRITQFFIDHNFCLKPADAILISGTAGEKSAKSLCPPSSKGTILVPSHSFDFDREIYSQQVCDGFELNLPESYFVFIDQALDSHPDFAMNGMLAPMGDAYLKELLVYFSELEMRHNVSVLIAMHPKRPNEDVFRGFRSFKNKTSELIKHSKGVLAHFSTALNIAVTYNKPVSILTVPGLDDVAWVKVAIESHGQAFGVVPTNLDDAARGALPIFTSQEQLQSYRDQFVRHPKAPDLPWWKIMTKFLEKHL